MERRRRSYLWGYFSVQKSDGCNKFAQCAICERTLRFTTSVTNLRRHLERKHPKSLSIARRSSNPVSSAISSVLYDHIYDGVNCEDAEQSVYSSTHIVDCQSPEPEEYSSTVQTAKDTANESEASAPMLADTNKGTTTSVSSSPAVLPSVDTKRKWRESKIAELQTVPRKQLSSPSKEYDEFDLFGMSIAAKMRKISRTNNTQCIIAEKLISEVILIRHLNVVMTEDEMSSNLQSNNKKTPQVPASTSKNLAKPAVKSNEEEEEMKRKIINLYLSLLAVEEKKWFHDHSYL